MKSKIIETGEVVKFKPFKLEIEVETVEEARTLFHLGNISDVTEHLGRNWYGHDFSCYSLKLGSVNLSSGKIKNIIEHQGFCL